MAVYQYYVPILSPVTDNALLESVEEGNIFPRKNVPDTSVNLGTAAYERTCY